MKLRHLVLCISLLALAETVDAESRNPFLHTLPFESGTIQYAISGMEEGSETIYVRKYGEETATYRKTITSMMGMKVETNTLEITDRQWVYSYDLNDNSGVKSVNPARLMLEEYKRLSGGERSTVQRNAERFGLNAVNGQEGQVELFAARILGYDCDKSSGMGVTVYSIHGSSLPLKTESELMGRKMNMVATSLDKGQVDGRYFQHPAGVEVTYDQESEVMARYTAQQTIAWLKAPQAPGSFTLGSLQQGRDRQADERLQHVPQEDPQPLEKTMKLFKEMFGGQQE